MCGRWRRHLQRSVKCLGAVASLCRQVTRIRAHLTFILCTHCRSLTRHPAQLPLSLTC